MRLRDNPVLLRAFIVIAGIAVFCVVFSLFVCAARGLFSKAYDARQYFGIE